jgi:hypothetical protein
MENWKDIDEEENWASKVGLVTLFFMEWHAPMPNVMLEFVNTFLIKGIVMTFLVRECYGSPKKQEF